MEEQIVRELLGEWTSVHTPSIAVYYDVQSDRYVAWLYSTKGIPIIKKLYVIPGEIRPKEISDNCQRILKEINNRPLNSSSSI